jgi:DUF4097 and DUF4098 domain-containing protein YvlB
VIRKISIVIFLMLGSLFLNQQFIQPVKAENMNTADSIKPIRKLSEDTLVIVKKRDNLEVTVFPNPFKTITTVNFYLDQNDTVSLRVYDVEGRVKKSILKSLPLLAGEHIFEIDLEDFNADFYLIQVMSRKGKFGKRVVIKE